NTMDDKTIADARTFLRQFDAVRQLVEGLEQLNGLKRDETSLRRAIKALTDEVSVLRGQRDRELNARHAEHTKLLDSTDALARTKTELSSQIADLRAKAKGLENECEASHGRLADFRQKLAALKSAA